MSNNQAGFTLVELLIAVALFAVLGIACARLFDMIWRVEQGVSARSQALREVQRTLAALEHDVTHAITWYTPFYLDQQQLTFASAGWRNPLDLPRSELQQVSYRVEGSELWRHARGDNSAATQRRLLGELVSARWQVLAADGQWLDSCETPCRPLALRLALEHSLYGSITRVLRWPGGGQ